MNYDEDHEMMYCYEDYERMLYRIIEYSYVNNNFNGDTFYGIKDNYNEYSTFTKKQKSAILNVYNKWSIEKWYDNKEKLKTKTEDCDLCDGSGMSVWNDDLRQCLQCTHID
jgi:hypothetical protein